eukprot:TRINITY_DN3526_c0_g1_i1.p1 TRINITY_DN3526_c0_g1~~TRINITY_DN3526_c0_g1_i1.p1  ORF type:complete len:477 (+),score=86.60 TRINITY_DN3526_c0_g1_i1:13-1443(+)
MKFKVSKIISSKILLISLVYLFTLAHTDSSCFFANDPLYTVDHLLNNQSIRDHFIQQVLYWDGFFHQPDIGVNLESGLSYDGCPIDYETGVALKDQLHQFSAASKESLHVSMLALYLSGDRRAQTWFSQYTREDVISILEAKISTYEQFNVEFPGFGGFLPWYVNSNNGIKPTWDFQDRVPGLDNGQLAWALEALTFVLDDDTELYRRYQNYTSLLKKNSVLIFYNGDGYVRAVTKIKDTKAPPSQENYENASDGYFLDDPYEGELMVFWMDLYGTWSNPKDREQIWINKRAKLQNVEYHSKQHGPITVQRGFSGAHIPGLYASVTDVKLRGYISATGIQSIAFQPIQRKDIITPYGAFPVLLADQAVGLTWLQNMIKAPRMQGMYGSTEAININGTEISNIVTWDSKVTTDVAILGGIKDMTIALMKQQGIWERFSFIANREYTLKFPTLKGEDAPFGLPTQTIPVTMKPFPSCQ